MTTDVIYGGGDQTLWHVPHRDGRPLVVASGATYRLINLRYSEEDLSRVVVATTAAGTSAVATTTTAVAGYGAADPRVVVVTSATGIVAGRSYLLRTSSRVEVVVQVEDFSGTTLRVSRPVEQSIASGSAFLGLELEATFPLAEADDISRYNLGNNAYAVDWTYDGRTTRELVRIRRATSQCPVSSQDLLRRIPGLGSRLGADHQAEEFISAAWYEVRTRLLSSGQDVDQILTTDAVAAAVCYEAARSVYSLHTDDVASRMVEQYSSRFEGTLGNLSTGAQKPGVEILNSQGARLPEAVSGRYFQRR